MSGDAPKRDDADTRPSLDLAAPEPGTLSRFDLAKQFGFVRLQNGRGDAFLHMSVLKQAGYVWLPRGTTLQIRTVNGGKTRRVTEVVLVDTSTARPGEKEAVLRRAKDEGAQP